MRILAAMSGGVDSAVAAARAVDAGHDVTGVHLALSRTPATLREGARGCCSVEDAGAARRAADVLGIPFYVWDMAERVPADVIDDFVEQYSIGNTPNPCLRCNEKIKFAAVLDRARALDFDAVVTGHYARLDGGVLRRAADAAKDQSYVLAVLTRDQLAGAMFPLGDTVKDQVRIEAAERGLAVAAKPDSHDICFIPDGDTQGFLNRRLGEQAGDIVEAGTGAVLGAHRGTHGFTVGQRRGLALDRPAADGQPRYVLSLVPATRTVVVGPAEALEVTQVVGAPVVWNGSLDPEPESTIQCSVQLRAHGMVSAATALVGPDGSVTARLHEPQRGVAPGQALVLYGGPAGDQVLGSATIRRADRAPETSASSTAP